MRIVRYAYRNIIRNPFLSFSSIFVITLLVFFVNVLLLLLALSNQFIASVNDRISFTINFQSGYTLDDMSVKVFIRQLVDTFSGSSITPISKAEALNLLKERAPDLTTLIENTGENPLPDSVRIDDIPLDRYGELNALISSKREILHYDSDAMNRKFLDYSSQYERVSMIVKILRIIELGVYGLLFLFLFTMVVIIYMVIGNSIYYHAREREIVMLVGGDRKYIYGPYLVQGVFYALISTMLVGGVIFISMKLIPDYVFTEMFARSISDIFIRFPRIFVYEIVIFCLLGLLAASLSLLRKDS